MARVVIDSAAVKKVSEDSVIRRAVGDLGDRILEDAQDNIRRMGLIDTGALLRSGFTEQEGTNVRIGFGDLTSGVDYAKYVHEGTRAHEIRARDGGLLAFPGRGGEMVFVRSVHHPGTRPHPFLSEAALKRRAEW